MKKEQKNQTTTSSQDFDLATIIEVLCQKNKTLDITDQVKALHLLGLGQWFEIVKVLSVSLATLTGLLQASGVSNEEFAKSVLAFGEKFRDEVNDVARQAVNSIFRQLRGEDPSEGVFVPNRGEEKWH